MDAAGSAEPVVQAWQSGVFILIGIVCVTLAVSSLCSLCEAALYAVSPAFVEQCAESGSASGRRLRSLRQNIGRPIAAILTLNTLSHTVGATMAGGVAAELFDSLGLGIFSGLFTLAILYISEIIPKTLGVAFAEVLAPRLTIVIQWMIWGLLPLVWLCHKLTQLFHMNENDLAAVSKDELLVMARHGQRAGAIRAEEARWVQNALKLDEVKVADILTPRTMVESMPADTSIAEASRMFTELGFNRVPATVEGNLDRINGVVMRRDVHDAVEAGRGDQPVSTVMREPTFVPEAMKVSDLLAKFLRDRKHLYIVADEYGGTAGVVTLEDALETLLGSEIVDETDHEADLQRVARVRAAKRMRFTQLPDVTADRPPGNRPTADPSHKPKP